jgi:beta-lactamase regulating signal transducer with metallopeptidase domain
MMSHQTRRSGFPGANTAQKCSVLVILANLWLAGVLVCFFVLRVLESRTFDAIVHHFSLR